MSGNFRRALVWSALGLAVLAVLGWSFWPRAIAVETAPVVRGHMQVEVVDEGRTRVRETYRISAPVTGKLLRIEEHAGDFVEANKTVLGAILPTSPAFLDIRTRAQALSAIKSAQAARDLARSEVQRAEAQLKFAEADLRRAEILVKDEAISRVNLERAQLARDTTVTQLATANAALKAKQYDLETARAQLIGPNEAAEAGPVPHSIPLVAPVSGRILRVLQESESVVPAGTAVMEIGDPKTLEVLAELVSEDAVKVRVGNAALITDWGGDLPLNARVRRIEPGGFTKISALGVEEQRVNVLLDFTDRPERWASIADGYRVVAHITVWQSTNVLQVPVSSLFRIGTGWATFVVRDGRAKLTPVSVGKANDEVGQVLRGLEAGDRVIVHPSDRVADGVQIDDTP